MENCSWCYEHFVDQAIPSGELELIRQALQRGQLTGNSRFVDKVEQFSGLRIELRRQGRSRTPNEK